MTVKIKDKDLYKGYESAMEIWLDNEGNAEVLVLRFLNYIDNSHSGNEVQKVVNAIFNGEEVELDEQKYMVPLPHLIFDGDQIYLVKSNISKDIMTDWNPFNPDIQSKLTLDEIPEEYRKWAKKVED